MCVPPLLKDGIVARGPVCGGARGVPEGAGKVCTVNNGDTRQQDTPETMDVHTRERRADRRRRRGRVPLTFVLTGECGCRRCPFPSRELRHQSGRGHHLQR